MPKYRVFLAAVANGSVEVEASDEEEAVELVFQEELPWICAQCSGWGRSYSMDLGEWELEGDFQRELLHDISYDLPNVELIEE